MKRFVLAAAVCCAVALFAACASAQGVGLNAKIASDKKAVANQKSEIKDNAQSARGEEAELKDAIRDAVAAGDTEKAQSLRAQLRDLHKESVSEKQSDKDELDADRKDLKKDRSIRHTKESKRR